jgi:hypothetical protein
MCLYLNICLKTLLYKDAEQLRKLGRKAFRDLRI